MNPPSEEQTAIVDAVRGGRSVVVDAVAGSGKTTTILWVARACPERRVLNVTYNSQLKEETRARAAQAGISNLEIHTYHSLVVRHYDRGGYTDGALQRVVDANLPPKAPIAPVDVLVVDEAQDMTPYYYALLHKFMADVGPACACASACTVVVLGDRYQGIYDFKDADVRFLTLAQQLYGRFAPTHLSLQRSYRVTGPIARFVNEALIGEPRIVATKPGPPVDVYVGNPFYAYREVRAALLEWFRNGSASPGDVFVLAGSLKSGQSPARILENKLVELKVPCEVPSDDDAVLDDDVIRGKVCFTTFHQAKGRERPIVVVYGFDAGYMRFFCRDKPTDLCPSTVYVACTRASKHLLLVGDARNGPLPFLKRSMDEMRARGVVRMFGRWARPAATGAEGATATAKDYSRTSPTELVKYLRADALSMLAPMVDALFRTTSPPAADAARVPSKVTHGDNVENVADVNGLAIPAMWESRQRGGTNTIFERVTSLCATDAWKSASTLLDDHLAAVAAAPPASTAEFLHLCNVYQTLTHGYHFKLAQIPAYDWLAAEMAAECLVHMTRCVGEGPLEFERALQDGAAEIEYRWRNQRAIRVNGRVDALDATTVWEFKCVDAVLVEHLLQVCVYAWMWHKWMRPRFGARAFKLLNVRTGEVRELEDANRWMLEDVVDALFKYKFDDEVSMSDAEFVANMRARVRAFAPPPPSPRWEGMTLKELRGMCKKQGVVGYTAMKRDRLVQVLAGRG